MWLDPIINKYQQKHIAQSAMLQRRSDQIEIKKIWSIEIKKMWSIEIEKNQWKIEITLHHNKDPIAKTAQSTWPWQITAMGIISKGLPYKTPIFFILSMSSPHPTMSAPTTFAQIAEWMVAVNVKVDHLELWLARSNAVRDQQRLVVSLMLFWQRCRWCWL